jgi:hypothetical protein
MHCSSVSGDEPPAGRSRTCAPDEKGLPGPFAVTKGGVGSLRPRTGGVVRPARPGLPGPCASREKLRGHPQSAVVPPGSGSGHRSLAGTTGRLSRAGGSRGKMTGGKNHKPLELNERKISARFIFPRHRFPSGRPRAGHLQRLRPIETLQILGTRPRMTPGGVGRFVFQACRVAWFIFRRG